MARGSGRQRVRARRRRVPAGLHGVLRSLALASQSATCHLLPAVYLPSQSTTCRPVLVTIVTIVTIVIVTIARQSSCDHARARTGQWSTRAVVQRSRAWPSPRPPKGSSATARRWCGWRQHLPARRRRLRCSSTSGTYHRGAGRPAIWSAAPSLSVLAAWLTAPFGPTEPWVLALGARNEKNIIRPCPPRGGIESRCRAGLQLGQWGYRVFEP